MLQQENPEQANGQDAGELAGEVPAAGEGVVAAETAVDPAVEPDTGAAIVSSVFEWFERGIERLLPTYGEHPLLQVAVLVLLSVLIAGLASWFLKRVVAGIFRRTATDLDDHLLAALAPPIYISMLAVGLRVASERLELSARASERVGDSLATLVVLVWMVAAFQACGLVLRALAARHRRSSAINVNTISLFDNLIKVALFGIAAYTVLVIWGGDPRGLLTAGGIVGIAVGFAAKDTLANLFAGVFIFADSPYKIGDFITLDSGERGMVTQIGIRSTRLLTRDDVEITIPNAVMGNARITNESGGPHVKYRVRVQVGVAYGSDVDRVREVLTEIAAAETMVCAEPEPRVRFRAFGASSLDFELLGWIDEPVLRGRTLDSLYTAIYKRFGKEGIEIPYAKRDVYIKELPTRDTAAAPALAGEE
ncbi:MAG TPA: mechanosensitive ion channel family protein [Thermoanaerobaculia bacterium]|nr:mechanosensitive ion channel family protein [Thermoanaerobaculia bacterium]